jgi:hypothetical protein
LLVLSVAHAIERESSQVTATDVPTSTSLVEHATDGAAQIAARVLQQQRSFCMSRRVLSYSSRELAGT